MASAGIGGTSFLFQWRERVSGLGQFSFDGGIAALPHARAVGFVGAQYAYQLAQPSADLPFELLGIGGLDYAFGNGDTYWRIPVGIETEHQLEKTKGRLVDRSHPRRRPANSVSILRERVRTA